MPTVRRNRRQLERDIREAMTIEEEAMAYYHLGLFHDNNGREAEAIPYYERAQQLGLDDVTRAQALGWLASSLYKIGKSQEALQKIDASLAVNQNAGMASFLVRLRRRINRRTIQ